MGRPRALPSITLRRPGQRQHRCPRLGWWPRACPRAGCGRGGRQVSAGASGVCWRQAGRARLGAARGPAGAQLEVPPPQQQHQLLQAVSGSSTAAGVLNPARGAPPCAPVPSGVVNTGRYEVTRLAEPCQANSPAPARTPSQMIARGVSSSSGRLRGRLGLEARCRLSCTPPHPHGAPAVGRGGNKWAATSGGVQYWRVHASVCKHALNEARRTTTKCGATRARGCVVCSGRCGCGQHACLWPRSTTHAGALQGRLRRCWRRF